MLKIVELVVLQHLFLKINISLYYLNVDNIIYKFKHTKKSYKQYYPN